MDFWDHINNFLQRWFGLPDDSAQVIAIILCFAGMYGAAFLRISLPG